MRIAVIAITRNGAQLGSRLCDGLPGSELFVSNRYSGQSGDRRTEFAPDELKRVLATEWKNHDGFVMIMATGIVVRMIASLLESKATDPAVVVMDDAGRFAVSLLSGHLGGANELAERCAVITGSRAVITTATDSNRLPSFDLFAKEAGWVIDDLSRVKILNRLLLDHEEIAVVDPTGRIKTRFHDSGTLVFHETITGALQSGAAGFLFVTNHHIPPQSCPDNSLILRPRNLVLGIGCNRGTPADEIENLVKATMTDLLLSPASICSVATAAAKKDEAGLISCAERLKVPLLCFDSDRLNAVVVPSPPSEHAMAAIGAAGVAEPAAILASGGGILLLKKVKSGNVTLAIAEKQEVT